jgi:hypothetical protein
MVSTVGGNMERETRQQIRERLGLPEPNREFWRKYMEEGKEACVGYGKAAAVKGA